LKNSICFLKSFLVNDKILLELSKLNFSETGTRRICFHENENSNLHYMLIEVEVGKNYPPHKHLDGVEILILIEGSLDFYIWKDGPKSPPEILNLDSSNIEISKFIFIPENIFHTSKPKMRTKFIEIKPGPFVKNNLVIADLNSIIF